MNLKVYPMIVVSKSLKNEKRNNMTTEEFAYLIKKIFFFNRKIQKSVCFHEKMGAAEFRYAK